MYTLNLLNLKSQAKKVRLYLNWTKNKVIKGFWQFLKQITESVTGLTAVKARYSSVNIILVSQRWTRQAGENGHFFYSLLFYF